MSDRHVKVFDIDSVDSVTWSDSLGKTYTGVGYLTGRREIAYSGTEACMYFAGSRGAVLPYGYYGPYVPSGWIPPGWVLPVPPPAR